MESVDEENKKVRVLSLFTGAGGLDIGFHKTGFEVVGCLEIDKPSCNTLRANIGNYVDTECLIINEDIRQVEPSQLGLGTVDFIIGGPPCQSFSAAGRRAGGVTGINDARGSLFWYYCQFIKHFQPKGFLFENVRGILQANSLKDWEIIKASFAELGYTLTYRILDAADFGAPQHRERLILVGTREDAFLLPRPVYGPDSLSKTPHLTVGEAFSDIDDPNEVVPPYGGKYGDLLDEIPPGMNYLYFTEKFGHPNPKFAWRSKFSDFLYKLNPGITSKTLVASQGRYGGPFHWKGRKLTVPELKRIQSFPDDYVITGGYSVAAKQIGNSVAPRFAEYLAKAVMNQLFDGQFAIDYISDDTMLTFDRRKGNKAKETRKKVVKLAEPSQLNLFQEGRQPDWPVYSLTDRTEYQAGKVFDRRMNLTDGIWKIDVKKVGQKAERLARVHLRLSFKRPVLNIFNEINASLHSDTAWDINTLWDSIHDCVTAVTSYEGVQPLYGHFTEPYPQFTLQSDATSADEQAVVAFINSVSEFAQLGEIKPISTLKTYSNDADSYDFIIQLRAINFDIRVHETNRAIPEGFYKVCYPFTLYSKGRSYVVWSDKGSHKTGDVKVVKTNSGYEVEAYEQKN